MSKLENARKFFDACESGKGRSGCADYVADGATFHAQAGAVADIETLLDYTDWMEGGIAGPFTDTHYDIHASAFDEENSTALFFGTFHATHGGEGGPVPPTGKSTSSEFVYAMKMNDEGKIEKMTKIWNDGHAFAEMGWS